MASHHDATSHQLPHLFLRTTWLFQALIASPIFVLLGLEAFIFSIFNNYETLYDFVTELSTALLAAGIIFIVVVQRRLSEASKVLTLRLELGKAVLATGLWLWFLLDAIFGPGRQSYYGGRGRRIAAAGISSVLLVILFFSTVGFAAYDLRSKARASQAVASAVEDGERQPLLAA